MFGRNIERKVGNVHFNRAYGPLDLGINFVFGVIGWGICFLEKKLHLICQFFQNNYTLCVYIIINRLYTIINNLFILINQFYVIIIINKLFIKKYFC